MYVFIYWAAPGRSYSTWDLQSSLWHEGFLVAAGKLLAAACGIQFLTRDQSWTPRTGSTES